MNEANKTLATNLLDSNPNEQLKALGIIMLSVLEEIKKLNGSGPKPDPAPSILNSTGTFVGGHTVGVAYSSGYSGISRPTASNLTAANNAAAQIFANKVQNAMLTTRSAAPMVVCVEEYEEEVMKPLFDRIFGL